MVDEKLKVQFASISDFFQNATEAQKREVFLSILARANKAQREVMEKSPQYTAKR